MKGKKLTDFLFPVTHTCNVCRREIFSGGYFCEDCEKNMPYNDGIICNHCGRKIFNNEEYCSSCSGRETYFDKARSAFIYKKPVSDLIMQLKYKGKRYLAEIFAERLALIFFENFFPCDFVVFTPMTKKRIKERGYNQAEILAEEFCKITGLDLKGDILIKSKDTPRQVTRGTYAERRKNLEGSFKVSDKKSVVGKNIILIDDVMTTGSTVELLSEQLKKAGANSVFVLTAASGVLGGKKNDEKSSQKEKFDDKDNFENY